jgi:hypothetical protein
MTLYRVEKLIDLACSTTHEEEARTAALTACRMIRRLGLRVAAPLPDVETRGFSREPSPPAHAWYEPSPRPRPAASRPPPRPPREKPPNGGAWHKAAASGRCESCGDNYAYGDDVYEVNGVLWCAGH